MPQIHDAPAGPQLPKSVDFGGPSLIPKSLAGPFRTEIKEAVQRIFKVKVDRVRTAIYHGKFRRRGRAEGFRSDWKKAYVKLAPGEKMIEYAENL